MPVTTSNLSTSYRQELTRNEIIRRAYQVAGLLATAASPSADDISLASDLLNLELDSLQSEGIVTRSVEITTLALTTSTATYTLPDDTLDVTGMAAIVTSGTDTPVEPMSRDDYMAISQKSSEGTPSRYWVERLSSVRITLWPVPSGSSTLRYQKVKFLRDMDGATNTLDLDRYFGKYIVYALAAALSFAKSMPSERVVVLKTEAMKEKAVAKAYNQPHGPALLHVAHRTGWR